jgi:hypothetical protein
MQRLENKLNLTASIAMIYMVIEKTYMRMEHRLAAP